MAPKRDASDQEAKENQKSREELKERIQSLEWSLAEKNRENRNLKAEVEDRKQELANLTAENNELKGNSSSDNSQSG
jgi:hypothetical protein